MAEFECSICLDTKLGLEIKVNKFDCVCNANVCAECGINLLKCPYCRETRLSFVYSITTEQIKQCNYILVTSLKSTKFIGTDSVFGYININDLINLYKQNLENKYMEIGFNVAQYRSGYGTDKMKAAHKYPWAECLFTDYFGRSRATTAKITECVNLEVNKHMLNYFTPELIKHVAALYPYKYSISENNIKLNYGHDLRCNVEVMNRIYLFPNEYVYYQCTSQTWERIRGGKHDFMEGTIVCYSSNHMDFTKNQNGILRMEIKISMFRCHQHGIKFGGNFSNNCVYMQTNTLPLDCIELVINHKTQKEVYPRQNVPL